MQLLVILQSTAALILANGTPVLAKKIFGHHFSYPVDAGLNFLDHKPLFGASKTYRGILMSVLVTTLVAPILGLEMETGALLAGAAMAGDLFSSFLKRQLDLPPSSQVIGIDQIPESLFPLVACRELMGLTGVDIAVTVGLFFCCDLALSRLFYRLGIRDEPY